MTVPFNPSCLHYLRHTSSICRPLLDRSSNFDFETANQVSRAYVNGIAMKLLLHQSLAWITHHIIMLLMTSEKNVSRSAYYVRRVYMDGPLSWWPNGLLRDSRGKMHIAATTALHNQVVRAEAPIITLTTRIKGVIFSRRYKITTTYYSASLVRRKSSLNLYRLQHEPPHIESLAPFVQKV